MRVRRLHDIAEYKVHDPSGEVLGTVKDVVVDVRNGRIAYVVISIGGLFGIGEKLVGVPWSRLQARMDKDKTWFLQADLTRKQLEKAKGVDLDKLPAQAPPLPETSEGSNATPKGRPAGDGSSLPKR